MADKTNRTGRVSAINYEAGTYQVTYFDRGESVTREINAISNGFRLSEMDLFQRGPGEICGVHQHGVTDFRVANLLRDYKILRVARKEAIDLLSEDANLESEPALKSELLRRLGNALELAITA